MATVPELKAQARELGIKGYSGMLKPALVEAIGNKVAENSERYGRSGLPTSKSESVEAERKNAETRTSTIRKVLASREAVASKPESVTREVSMPAEVDPKDLNLAVLARLAGSMGKSAKPMSNGRRTGIYLRTTGRVTSRQARRIRKNAIKVS